jgi:hypothetical protein
LPAPESLAARRTYDEQMDLQGVVVAAQRRLVLDVVAEVGRHQQPDLDAA